MGNVMATTTHVNESVQAHYTRSRLGDLILAALERAGLAELVDCWQGDATHLPFPDVSFDVVWTEPAAMNIPDKPRLYWEHGPEPAAQPRGGTYRSGADHCLAGIGGDHDAQPARGGQDGSEVRTTESPTRAGVRAWHVLPRNARCNLAQSPARRRSARRYRATG